MAQRDLRRHDLELNYLMSRLARIEEMSVTSETWRDYVKVGASSAFCRLL